MLSDCPATRTLVSDHACRKCEQRLDGVGCPNLSRVVPKAFCLDGCQYNQGGVCKSSKETTRALAGKDFRPVADVWDSEAPLCSYPRKIQQQAMTLDGWEV